MKAQTALEYLLTYSWVILVIVIVLGLLNYLGVFNLERWVSGDNRVVGLSTVRVSSFRALINGTVTLWLVNDANADINITSISINGSNLTSLTPPLPQRINAGQNLTIRGNSVLTGSVGDVFLNTRIRFVFNVINGAGNHTDSGLIYGHLDS